MANCAFDPCAAVSVCSLVKGCVPRRFPQAVRIVEPRELREDARKLAGTEPARTNRDPWFIQRKRKALTP